MEAPVSTNYTYFSCSIYIIPCSSQYPSQRIFTFILQSSPSQKNNFDVTIRNYKYYFSCHISNHFKRCIWYLKIEYGFVSHPYAYHQVQQGYIEVDFYDNLELEPHQTDPVSLTHLTHTSLNSFIVYEHQIEYQPLHAEKYLIHNNI